MTDVRDHIAGIDLLKIVACFGVVVLHFGPQTNFAVLSVPVFMFISAYLCGALFTGGDRADLLKRLKRLYVPFAFWGLLYLVLYLLLERSLDLIAIVEQLTIGVLACPVMYFLFLLMIFSLVLFRIGHSHHRWTVIVMILLFCVIMQYTGANAELFSYFPFEIRMVFGRFCELLPASLFGICFYLVRGISKSVAVSFGVVFFCTYMILMVIGVGPGCDGFMYQGMPLLAGTLGISMLGLNLSCGRLKVSRFAALTPGIYYTHLLVGKSLEMVIGKHRGWIEAVAVFVVSSGLVVVMKRINSLKEFLR